jgi:hypothetical protein
MRERECGLLLGHVHPACAYRQAKVRQWYCTTSTSLHERINTNISTYKMVVGIGTVAQPHLSRSSIFPWSTGTLSPGSAVVSAAPHIQVMQEARGIR